MFHVLKHLTLCLKDRDTAKPRLEASLPVKGRRATMSQIEKEINIAWIVVIALLTTVLLVIFNGLVISILWSWFIPKTFAGAPTLSIAESMGISLVVSALIRIPAKFDEDQKPFATITEPLVRGLLLLGLGFVVQSIAF